MKRIYELSSSVVIWLGLEHDESDVTLSFITTAGRDPVDCFRGVGIKNQLQAVRKLLERPYWHRLWIIQEAVVASKVTIQCGNTNTTWRSLSSFKKVVIRQIIGSTKLKFRDRLALSPLLDTVAFKLDLMRVAPGANKLEELLRAFSAAQCSDIRDKIYGLVGLASDAADLVIDYSKTPFDLFADVMLLEERDPPEVSRRRRIKFAQFLQGVLAGKVETPTSKVHTRQGLFS